jgi:hypothetical protein
MSDVFESYNSLASTMLDEWSRLGSRAAWKMSAGVYGPSHAADDAAAGATLAAESAWMWTAWTWEAFAKLAGLDGEPNVVQSYPFESPLPGATLDLCGPLARGPGLEQLPVRCVTIEPRQLGPDATEFELHADGSGYCGGTYVGEVNATAAGETKAVHVWISIP